MPILQRQEVHVLDHQRRHSFAGHHPDSVGFFYCSVNLLDIKFNTETGNTFGFWNLGQMIYMAVVVISNLKIMTFSYSFSVLNIFANSASIALFFMSWIWVSSFDIGEIEHSFPMYAESDLDRR